MNGRITRQLADLAQKPGFTGVALKRLKGRLKDAWNSIPANERGKVDARELLERATLLRWRERAPDEVEP